MSNDRQKILELESLRGLAALLVVFYHLPKWNPLLEINLIKNGYLMVELFFVISGYVIFTAYSERINSWKDLAQFQFRRFGRLYPLHLLFLFLFLVIEIGKYLGMTRFGVENIRVVPFAANSFSALIEQIFLLQAVLPNGNATTFNGPAWSISVEFYTYTIFGLTVLLIHRKKMPAMVLLCAAPMLLLVMESTFGMENMLRCLAGFFLGCLTAYAVKDRTVSLPKYTSLLLFLLVGVYLHIKIEYELDFVIFFLTAILIALLVAQTNGWLNNILSKKPLIRLGELSYSIYMSQEFVIWIVVNFVKRVLKRPEIQGASGIWAASFSLFETIVAVSFTIFLVLLASKVVYLLIEKPLREWSRKFVLKNNEG